MDAHQDQRESGGAGLYKTSKYRLHLRTLLALSLAVIALVLLEVRGQETSHSSTLLARVGPEPPASLSEEIKAWWGRETGRFPSKRPWPASNHHTVSWVHGLPLIYLRRNTEFSDAVANVGTSPWALTLGVTEFSPGALLIDSMFAVLIIIIMIILLEKWMRRRGRKNLTTFESFLRQ